MINDITVYLIISIFWRYYFLQKLYCNFFFSLFFQINFECTFFFRLQIIESLNADPYCRQLKLSERLQSIAAIVESHSHAGPVSPLPPSQHLTSPSHMPPVTLGPPPTHLTSAHMHTLPHIAPTTSSHHHVVTSMPHVTSSPLITCPSQQQQHNLHHISVPQHLTTSSSTHSHLSNDSQMIHPLTSLAASSHYLKSSANTPSHFTTPSHHYTLDYIHHQNTSHPSPPSNNSTQLSEL